MILQFHIKMTKTNDGFKVLLKEYNYLDDSSIKFLYCYCNFSDETFGQNHYDWNIINIKDSIYKFTVDLVNYRHGEDDVVDMVLNKLRKLKLNKLKDKCLKIELQ